MKPIIRRTSIKRTFAAGTAACLLCFTFAWADHKPGHNPGGGGGGGGGTATYTIVPFLSPGFTSVGSIVNDLNEQGQAVGFAELSGGANQAVHLDLAGGAYTSLPQGETATG